MEQDTIRVKLYNKLEQDFNDEKKWKLDIQQYILELEKFLTDN